ncbi:MAG: hypothetical protein RLZZ59_846 [Pseudomonadota bacterium]|jgi:hemolysin activation/secretion protein
MIYVLRFVVYFRKVVSFLGLILFTINVYASDCFKLTNIEIKNTVNNLETVKVMNFIEKYKNRCIDHGLIEDLVREFTNYYVGKGYVGTKILIPEQNIKSGTLCLDLIIGRVERIENKENGVLRYRPNIFPGSVGGILNLRDLEQGLDNMSNLRSNKGASMHFKPGTGFGDSIVVIENAADKKWFLNTGIDNYGSKLKGQHEWHSSYRLEDFIGMSESYSFAHKRSVGDDKKYSTRSYSAGFAVPYGYNNISLSYGYTKYRNFINATTQRFNNKGKTHVIKGVLDRVIYRDGNGKTTLGISAGRDIYSNYISDTKIQISSYKIDKASLSLKHHRKLDASLVGFGVEYVRGINKNYKNKFGSKLYPAHVFDKINYEFSWMHPINLDSVPGAARFTTSLNGQYSSRVLSASEKFSVGGFASVRGFKNSVENTDKGLLFRNEMAFNVSRYGGDYNNKIISDLELFVAYDLGRFWSKNEEGIARGSMSGIAGGFRNNRGLINFDFTVARALSSKYIKRTPLELYISVGLNI